MVFEIFRFCPVRVLFWLAATAHDQQISNWKCFYRVATFNLKFWQNLKISDHHVAKSLKFILGFEIFEKSHYELWTIPFSPKLWYFLTVFKPLCNFSGFHCFHFQYELFWPFPFKSPQLLPCRIQSRRPKFWTKFWTKFPQTSFTVNQVMNEVLNWQKKLAVYYMTLILTIKLF